MKVISFATNPDGSVNRDATKAVVEMGLSIMQDSLGQEYICTYATQSYKDLLNGSWFVNPGLHSTPWVDGIPYCYSQKQLPKGYLIHNLHDISYGAETGMGFYECDGVMKQGSCAGMIFKGTLDQIYENVCVAIQGRFPPEQNQIMYARDSSRGLYSFLKKMIAIACSEGFSSDPSSEFALANPPVIVARLGFKDLRSMFAALAVDKKDNLSADELERVRAVASGRPIDDIAFSTAVWSFILEKRFAISDDVIAYFVGCCVQSIWPGSEDLRLPVDLVEKLQKEKENLVEANCSPEKAAAYAEALGLDASELE